jgi:hypothetical protein
MISYQDFLKVKSSLIQVEAIWKQNRTHWIGH